MLKKKFHSAILSIVILLPFFPGNLQAQFVCQGTACSLLPWTDAEMFQTLGDYKIQYFDLLAKDMAIASMTANLSSPPIGTVNLSGYTYGIGASGGYVKTHKTSLFNTSDRSVISNLDVAGGALVPKVFFGFNVGALRGESYKPFTDTQRPPPWFSPARFDIYLSLGSSSYENKDKIEYNAVNGELGLTKKYKINAKNEGLDLRYHLIEGKEIVGGPLLRFMGLSVGGGFHQSEQNLFFFQPDSKSVIELSAGNNLIWSGGDVIRYSSRTASRIAEMRTGIQLLYFLNLTATVGTSQNISTGSIQGIRAGRIYGESDLSAALGINPPDAVLMLNSLTPFRMNRSIGYQAYGIELNFRKFKITAETMYTKKFHVAGQAVLTGSGVEWDKRRGTGWNIGFRYEF